MASHLNELDSDSLLVMYIAGELTNGDKAAFERRLANEPALAAELQRVREAQAFCADSIATVDTHGKLPVSEGVAIRRVSRAIQQWQVDRIRSASPTQKKGLLFPWWSYPVAVAASLIIAFLVWSLRQQPVADMRAEVTPVPANSDSDGTGGDDSSSDAPDMTRWMASSFGVSFDPSEAEESVVPVMLEDPALSMFPEETVQ
jgi:hypothetical protein